MLKYISKRAISSVILIFAVTFLLFALLFDFFPDRTHFKGLAGLSLSAGAPFHVYDDDIVRTYTWDEYYSDEYWDFLIPQWGEKHTYRHKSDENLAYLGYKSLFDMHKMKFSHLRSIDRAETLDYTYADVFERIYKITSADDISAVSSAVYEITDRAEIEALYDIISRSEWQTSLDSQYITRQYACRAIDFMLKNGEIIDILNYDHRTRMLFSSEYASSLPLPAEDAGRLEQILGLETYWKYREE